MTTINQFRIGLILILTFVSFIFVVAGKSCVTETAKSQVNRSVIFFRSASLLLTRMIFDPIRRVEFFAAVLTNVAGLTCVESHVEGHGSNAAEIFSAEI